MPQFICVTVTTFSWHIYFCLSLLIINFFISWFSPQFDFYKFLIRGIKDFHEQKIYSTRTAPFFYAFQLSAEIFWKFLMNNFHFDYQFQISFLPFLVISAFVLIRVLFLFVTQSVDFVVNYLFYIYVCNAVIRIERP